MSMSSRARRAAAPLVLLIVLLLSGCTVAAEASPRFPTPTPAPPVAVAAAAPAADVLAAQPTIQRVTAVPQASATSARTTSTTIPTPAAPAATPTLDPLASPTAIPTPSPRAAGTRPRVGLQVGHLRSNELPEELARLRTSTGARWGNVTEADLNQDIVNRIKPLLEAQGVIVDVIPATVPVSYDADAFLAIHADGSASPAARGWKLATPWRTSEASRALMNAVAATYGVNTGLPEDVGGVTVNMKGYYAFNYRRHEHAIARTTPAIIVEMGFMSSAADRGVLFGQPDLVAKGIADGVMAYLRARDPNNGAALLPPEFSTLRVGPNGGTLRAAPRDDARVLATLDPEARLFPYDKAEGWYQVFVRGSSARLQGWIHESQVEVTNEQPVFPTASSSP
jgi:hypothetical protein